MATKRTMLGLEKLMGRFDRIASHLTRQTSGRALIPEIDGLRSVAILSVLLYHAHGNYCQKVGFAEDSTIARFIGDLLRTGEYGVPLFFVISGFILALPFAKYQFDPENNKKISLKRYFYRRITRLEPPYILMLCFALLVRGGSIEQIREWIPNFFASLFYVHNIVFDKSSVLNVVAWSLEVEVQFYILAPLLAYIFALKNTTMRRTIFVLLILAFSFTFGVTKPIHGLSLLNHMSYFATGMLFTDIYLVELQNSKDRLWVCDSMVVLALSGVFLVAQYHIAPQIVTPWLILIAYVALFKGRLTRRFFSWIPIVILGGMCYTIYLWHIFLIVVFQQSVGAHIPTDPEFTHMLIYVLLASLFAIIGSTVLFVLIERPTMNPRWPQILWKFIKQPVKTISGRNLESSATEGL